MFSVPITLITDISSWMYWYCKDCLVFIVHKPFPLSHVLLYFPGAPGKKTLLSALLCLLFSPFRPNNSSSLSAEIFKHNSEQARSKVWPFSGIKIRSLDFSFQHHGSTFLKFCSFYVFRPFERHFINLFQCSQLRFWELCWFGGRRRHLFRCLSRQSYISSMPCAYQW